MPLPPLTRAALAAAVCTQAAAQTPPPADAPQTVEVVGERERNAAGKQTLTRDELARIPGSAGDPMRALQSLPGVTVADDSSTAPAVRGARPDDNLYYMDFLPVGYLFHLGGFASVFSPELIRRFDLASAAWSPEYGDAVGAIFDVSLRAPRSDRIGGKLDFGLIGASALAEGPLGPNLSFFASARRSWFDLVARNGEDKTEGVTYTVPVYHDAQARLVGSPAAGQRLRLDFSEAGDRIDFNVKPGSKAGQRDPVLVGESRSRQAYRTLAATWEADVGSRVSNRLALGRMVDRASARVGAAGSVESTVTTTYLREQALLQLPAGHGLTVGGSLSRRQVDLALDFLDARCTEFDPDCDITSAARVVSRQKTPQDAADLYASDRWRLGQAWTITAGLRASRDGYLKQTFAEPRLGLEWNASPATQWSIGWGRHNQAAPPEETLPTVGNPQLGHVRSTHTVLGLNQSLGAGWSWRAELYAKTFSRFAIADPQLNYREGASGRSRGFELLLKKEATDRLSGFASLSVSRAERRNDATGESFRFGYDQPVIASLVGQYKLSDRWQFGARWGYHTGSPYTPVSGTDGNYADGRPKPVYGGVNSQRVPPYHRLDLRVDARFTPALSGYVDLINAYNRKNVAGYSYSADYATREPVYQLPAFISFGVQYAF